MVSVLIPGRLDGMATWTIRASVAVNAARTLPPAAGLYAAAPRDWCYVGGNDSTHWRVSSIFELYYRYRLDQFGQEDVSCHC